MTGVQRAFGHQLYEFVARLLCKREIMWGCGEWNDVEERMYIVGYMCDPLNNRLQVWDELGLDALSKRFADSRICTHEKLVYDTSFAS